MKTGPMPPLILASTSRYRRELLSRLGLPFDAARPETDETPLPGEAPEAMATRLSIAKAEAVALLNPGAWVIGSDQVAEFDGRTLGKPGGREAAIAQLSAMAGHTTGSQPWAATGVVKPTSPAATATKPSSAIDAILRFFMGTSTLDRWVDEQRPVGADG